nr:MAG TPA: Scorpion antimicrobial peptide [Caudoviricetes sp.]
MDFEKFMNAKKLWNSDLQTSLSMRTFNVQNIPD